MVQYSISDTSVHMLPSFMFVSAVSISSSLRTKASPMAAAGVGWRWEPEPASSPAPPLSSPQGRRHIGRQRGVGARASPGSAVPEEARSWELLRSFKGQASAKTQKQQRAGGMWARAARGEGDRHCESG